MNNTVIWTIATMAIVILDGILLFSYALKRVLVPTGNMIPRLRLNQQSGKRERYQIRNPDFNPNETPGPDNLEYIQAEDPEMATTYPNKVGGFMAMITVTGIILGLTTLLTTLRKQQGETEQVAALAGTTATNALAKATEASSKAFKAETAAISASAQVEQMDRAMKLAFGRTNITVGEKEIEVPNFGNVLRKEDVTELLANIDSRLNEESNTRSNAVAAVNGRLDTLTGSLDEVKLALAQLTRHVSGIPTNQVGTDTLAKLQQAEARITREIAAVKQTATEEIRTALTAAKAAAVTVPGSVIQPMTISRSDITLSYRRVGMFGKHSASLSYQATINGRPDMETNIVTLLEKFEKDHKVAIVKGLEEAASKKQPANKDKAIVKLTDRIRADFNAWVLGQWDFRRSGPAPQITTVTITQQQVLSGSEDE